MKQITILFLLVALNATVFSQNKLTVFSEIGEQFYVILNGVRQNDNPETNVQVDGLTADYYTAKIIFNNANIPDIDRKFLNVTGADCSPCAVTYKIKYDKKDEITMKMFNFTPLAQAPVQPNVTVVHYNTTPKAPIIGMQVTETTTSHSQGDHVNVGVNVGGFNMNVNVNDGFGSSTHSSTTTTTTTTIIPAQVMEVEETCYPMSTNNFNSLMSTLNAKTWDDDKMEIAKQASNSNCFTAKQIKQIMSTFEWEDAKLTFAKHAYANCYDQNNYYQVNDEFEWSDNVKKLNQYIGQ